MTLALRDRDPADGRRNIVIVTTVGLERLVEIDEVLQGVQERLLAPLTPSERATFVPLLAKVARRGAEPG